MRVLLTGGSGMLGQSLQRLAAEIAPDITLIAPSRAELPLMDRAAVEGWLAANPVEAVIHGAAKVGGIQANIADPVGFLSDNLAMNNAVITGAHRAGVGRLVFLGSSCMYPRDYRQPLVEEDVLAAPLEPTNEGYALSKIAGARLCDYISRQIPDRAYRTLIPCNLFGTGDHFGSAASHLIAAAITKVVDARDSGADQVEIWGSGQARREFLDVDHLSRFILTHLDGLADLSPMLNIGAGRDYSVSDYYRMVADLAGWGGSFVHDRSKPEGMMAKLMSSARAEAAGYRPPADITPDLARAIAAYEAIKRRG